MKFPKCAAWERCTQQLSETRGCIEGRRCKPFRIFTISEKLEIRHQHGLLRASQLTRELSNHSLEGQLTRK